MKSWLRGADLGSFVVEIHKVKQIIQNLSVKFISIRTPSRPQSKWQGSDPALTALVRSRSRSAGHIVGVVRRLNGWQRVSDVGAQGRG